MLGFAFLPKDHFHTVFHETTMMFFKSTTQLFTKLSALCVLISWIFSEATAFTTTKPVQSSPSVTQSITSLYGIQEWRDEARRNSQADESNDDDDDGEVVGSVPIHLVDSSKVALQGERVYLQFTEDDEVRLFQQAVDFHHGVFGLGFLYKSYGEDGTENEHMYDTISLLEIQDFNLMGDEFGIFLVAQVVGRALILHTNASVLAPEEPLKAVCEEIYNREEIKTLQQATEMGQNVVSLIGEVCQVERQHRMRLKDINDLDEEESRMDRFNEAARQALQSQKQQGAFQDGASEWDKLDAISWAAFSTSECLSNDTAYRLAALDNHCLTNRLQLATFWLTDVLADIKQAI